MGNIDRYPSYKGGKVTEVVVYANYIGLRQFYRYVVNIGRCSPYEDGQLDRFYCTMLGLTMSYTYGVHARSYVWGKRHKMAFSRQCKTASFFIALAELTRF